MQRAGPRSGLLARMWPKCEFQIAGIFLGKSAVCKLEKPQFIFPQTKDRLTSSQVCYDKRTLQIVFVDLVASSEWGTALVNVSCDAAKISCIACSCIRVWRGHEAFTEVCWRAEGANLISELWSEENRSDLILAAIPWNMAGHRHLACKHIPVNTSTKMMIVRDKICHTSLMQMPTSVLSSNVIAVERSKLVLRKFVLDLLVGV